MMESYKETTPQSRELKAMTALYDHWAQIHCHLVEAQTHLQSVIDIAEATMYLEKNELGLTWDVLYDLVDNTNQSTSFWHKMLEAANLMESPDRVKKAREKLGL